MANTYSAGIATAYGAAVRGGYTGTYDEWCALMADYATVGESAEQAAQNAAASANAAATSESNAATSAQNAAASESAASAAATDATEARADAQTAAGAASDSADNAASSALAASQSESAASTSASAAAGDATAAAGSASAAAQTLTDVNAAGAAQITAIDAEGQRVLASIPADYTDLSGEVSDLKSHLTEFQETGDIHFDPAGFQVGGIDTSTGDIVPSQTKRVVMTDISTAAYDMTLTADSAHKMMIAYYTNNVYEDVSSWKTNGSITLNAGQQYRLVIADYPTETESTSVEEKVSGLSCTSIFSNLLSCVTSENETWR